MRKFKAKTVVVDTNVAILANYPIENEEVKEGDEELSTDCILKCIKAIEDICNGGSIVLDCEGEILDEYKKNLCIDSKGVGNDFLRQILYWLSRGSGGISYISNIAITKYDENTYKEFPDHPDLKQFDASDRKFVAVANAHPDKPEILQAVDSKWWEWKDGLREFGISVNFLCEDYVKKKHQKRISKKKKG